jgi:hypothetical protein
MGHVPPARLEANFRGGIQPEDGRIVGPMSFGVANRQLSLADPTHAAENEQLSSGAERV